MSPRRKIGKRIESPKTLNFFTLQFLPRRPFGFSPRTLFSFNLTHPYINLNLLLPSLVLARLPAYYLSLLTHPMIFLPFINFWLFQFFKFCTKIDMTWYDMESTPPHLKWTLSSMLWTEYREIETVPTMMWCNLMEADRGSLWCSWWQRCKRPWWWWWRVVMEDELWWTQLVVATVVVISHISQSHSIFVSRVLFPFYFSL